MALRLLPVILVFTLPRAASSSGLLTQAWEPTPPPGTLTDDGTCPVSLVTEARTLATEAAAGDRRFSWNDAAAAFLRAAATESCGDNVLECYARARACCRRGMKNKEPCRKRQKVAAVSFIRRPECFDDGGCRSTDPFEDLSSVDWSFEVHSGWAIAGRKKRRKFEQAAREMSDTDIGAPLGALSLGGNGTPQLVHDIPSELLDGPYSFAVANEESSAAREADIPAELRRSGSSGSSSSNTQAPKRHTQNQHSLGRCSDADAHGAPSPDACVDVRYDCDELRYTVADLEGRTMSNTFWPVMFLEQAPLDAVLASTAAWLQKHCALTWGVCKAPVRVRARGSSTTRKKEEVDVDFRKGMRMYKEKDYASSASSFLQVVLVKEHARNLYVWKLLGASMIWHSIVGIAHGRQTLPLLRADMPRLTPAVVTTDGTGTVETHYVSGKFGFRRKFKDEVKAHCARASMVGFTRMRCLSKMPREIAKHPQLARHMRFLSDPKDVSARGGGYWSWKPHLVLRAMEWHKQSSSRVGTMLLVYSDVDRGDVFNDLEATVLQPMLDRGADFAIGQLGLENWCNGHGCPEERWTKEDVLSHFNATARHRRTGQYMASFFVIRNSARARAFVRDWADAVADWHLVSDAPSVRPSQALQAQVEHRHDQSLLSLLVKTQMVRQASLPRHIDLHNVYHLAKLYSFVFRSRLRSGMGD